MRIPFSLVFATACSIYGCNELPRHDNFAVGMERATVLERFGQPLRSQDIRKTGESVWGPIEEFWPRVPVGSNVEICSYRTTQEWAVGSGNRVSGSTELYFVGGSNKVSGLGFAPDGVVFEAAEAPSR